MCLFHDLLAMAELLKPASATPKAMRGMLRDDPDIHFLFSSTELVFVRLKELQRPEPIFQMSRR